MRRSLSSISRSSSSGRSGADDHAGERRVPAVRLVERRQPHEPVRPALGLEDPVGVLAADDHRRGLQAGLLPRARLEHLGLEAAALGPALVHPQQHLGPVLRVRAAAAGLDRDDRVAGVVLAVEERVLLEARRARRAAAASDASISSAISPSIASSSRASSYSRCSRLKRSSRFVSRACSAETVAACCWSSQNPGAESSLLELGDARARRIRVKGNHGPSRAGPRSPRAAPGAARASRSSRRW